MTVLTLYGFFDSSYFLQIFFLGSLQKQNKYSLLLKLWSLFFHIIYYLRHKCGNVDLSVFEEGCGPGGVASVFTIPFIKYFQYLSSRSRCNHNFNDPYQSTVGTTSAMLCTGIFLLE